MSKKFQRNQQRNQQQQPEQPQQPQQPQPAPQPTVVEVEVELLPLTELQREDLTNLFAEFQSRMQSIGIEFNPDMAEVEANFASTLALSTPTTEDIPAEIVAEVSAEIAEYLKAGQFKAAQAAIEELQELQPEVQPIDEFEVYLSVMEDEFSTVLQPKFAALMAISVLDTVIPVEEATEQEPAEDEEGFSDTELQEIQAPVRKSLI